jgi:hypothetical protein
MEAQIFSKFIKTAKKEVDSLIHFIHQDLYENKDLDYHNKYHEHQKSLIRIWAHILQNSSRDKLKRELQMLNLNDRSDEDTDSFLDALEFRYDGDDIVPSLVGAHIRSPMIAKGRLSAALDCKTNLTNLAPWKFHDELLEVYFQIYGRSRTFNEFVFNRLSDEKSINNAMVTIKFSDCSTTNKSFLDIYTDIKQLTKRLSVEITTINLSQELQDNLLPWKLLERFFEPVPLNEDANDRQLTEWYPQLCRFEKGKAANIISELAERAEMTYCYYTSDTTQETRETWEKLIGFIHPKEIDLNNETILYWNRRSRSIAKGIIKALQGICLYRYFANGSITTIAKESKREQSAITIGFNQESSNSQVIDTLQSAFFQPDFTLLLSYNPDNSKAKSPYNQLDQDIEPDQDVSTWKKVKESKMYGEQKAVFDKLIQLYNFLHPLCFSAHEGARLSFTAYISDQIGLSQFRCFHFFSPEDLMSFDKQKSLLIQSHYSLFLDGRTGFFFDKASNESIALVKPLSFFHSQDDHPLNLEEDSLTAQENTKQHEFFAALTKNCANMAVMSIEVGELHVFYQGRLILEYSRRYNFSLRFLEDNPRSNRDSSREKTSEWKFENIKDLLLPWIFRKLPSSLEPYAHSSAYAIATAVRRVSDTPGYGGLMIFAGTSMLDTMKTSLNDIKLSFWKEKTLYSCSPEQIVSMLIPDGSCLVNLDTFVIENQVYVVPIGDGKLVATSPEKLEPGKGTRHRTAQAITNKNIRKLGQKDEKVWSICISADGGVSVYSEGEKKTPEDITRCKPS